MSSSLIAVRNYWQIIADGLRLYKKYWLALTLPLLAPWFQIVLGSFLWVALPVNLFEHIKNIDIAVPVFLFLFFVAMLPGMLLFFRGFWHYLQFYSALNIMVRDVIEYGGCDPEVSCLKVQSRSTDFGLLLGFFCIVALIPLILTAMFALPVALIQLSEPVPSIILGLGLFVFTFLVLLVINYFSLSFQIFVFEPDGCFKVLDKSIKLVKQQYLKCFLILLTGIILISALLPWVVSFTLNLTHLLWLFNFPSQWLVNLYLNQVDFSQLPAELASVKQQAPIISLALTDLMCQGTVTVLLLPLGSLWHTLLYGDCKKFSE